MKTLKIIMMAGFAVAISACTNMQGVPNTNKPPHASYVIDEVRAGDMERPIMATRSAPYAKGGRSMPRAATESDILFAHGSAMLTDQAKRAIMSMVEGVPRTARITVIGGADTTGNYQVNQRLSAQRAQAVKNFLVAKGFNSRRINAEGHGENDLAIPTGDNVYEARNRRASISIR
ncbi:MAG: OmpA family protein [Dongiaceae bacterium]